MKFAFLKFFYLTAWWWLWSPPKLVAVLQ